MKSSESLEDFAAKKIEIENEIKKDESSEIDIFKDDIKVLAISI